MESQEDLGLVASTSFDPADVVINPLPVDKEEEHSWKEEEHKQKDEEQNHKEEEERTEIEAARKEVLKLILSRTKFMRKIGCPVNLLPLAYCKNLDYRKLLNRESNCEEIDWGNGPVDKEFLLEKEKALWTAAMEYRKVQNMDYDYDLIPSNMTLFPIMSSKCTWYHCNLVGCKRETPLKGVQQHFFLEISITRVKTVTACILLDGDVGNTCNACPSQSDILHPRKGGFTCGSKEGLGKEDSGSTPARALDRDAVSPGLPTPLPAMGNETLGPIGRRLSALFRGGTSRPAPPAIGNPPEFKSLTTMPNGRPGPITKRQLKLALALARGGTCSQGSSEGNPHCK